MPFHKAIAVSWIFALLSAHHITSFQQMPRISKRLKQRHEARFGATSALHRQCQDCPSPPPTQPVDMADDQPAPPPHDDQFDRAATGGLRPEDQVIWNQQLHIWEATTISLTKDMVCCAWCGRSAMGGNASLLRIHVRSLECPDTPPAAASSPLMASHMKVPNDHPSLARMQKYCGDVPL